MWNRGNEYTCNNRSIVGRVVFIVARVVSQNFLFIITDDILWNRIAYNKQDSSINILSLPLISTGRSLDRYLIKTLITVAMFQEK
jgi:hypothetical protein